MKHALVVVVLLALAPAARADNREAWQATFAASVTVTVGGAVAWWHGTNKVNEAEEALCDGGAYPECRSSATSMLSVEEIERLNAKGERGSTISYVGAGVTAVGLVVSGISLYKGFFAKPDERAIAVAPMVSKSSAGAVLSLRF